MLNYIYLWTNQIAFKDDGTNKHSYFIYIYIYILSKICQFWNFYNISICRVDISAQTSLYHLNEYI